MRTLDTRLSRLEQRRQDAQAHAAEVGDARAIILARLAGLAAHQPPGPPPTAEQLAQLHAYLAELATRRVSYA